MVELVVWDFEEESDLELMLQEANIEYQLCLNLGYGIRPPYLVVDGVPLDNKRSRRWVKEYGNDN